MILYWIMNTIYKKILFNIVPFHSLRDETLSIYPLDNTSETEIKLGQVATQHILLL